MTIPKRMRAVLRHLVERLASSTVEDAQARYDLGAIVQAVRQGKEPRGTDAAEIAAAIHRDVSDVRRCARVATHITPKEFAWMMTLRSRRGMPLTWSHVELLSRVQAASVRRELAREAMQHDLPVRALARLVVAAAH